MTKASESRCQNRSILDALKIRKVVFTWRKMPLTRDGNDSFIISYSITKVTNFPLSDQGHPSYGSANFTFCHRRSTKTIGGNLTLELLDLASCMTNNGQLRGLKFKR